MHAQIDRDVENLRSFRVIHAQKEDVAPCTVREIHAHGGLFPENRIRTVGFVPLQQFRAQTERLQLRMRHPEHPLIPADGSDTAAHLVCQRLKGQPVICRSQRTADGIAWTLRSLHGQKTVDGFFEATAQQMLVAMKWNHAPARRIRLRRQMEPVNRIQKEEGADLFVKVRASAPERIEFRTFRQQNLARCVRTDRLQRTVADRGILRRNDGNKLTGHGNERMGSGQRTRAARSSTMRASTSSRSSPSRPSASCAVSNP